MRFKLNVMNYKKQIPEEKNLLIFFYSLETQYVQTSRIIFFSLKTSHLFTGLIYKCIYYNHSLNTPQTGMGEIVAEQQIPFREFASFIFSFYRLAHTEHHFLHKTWSIHPHKAAAWLHFKAFKERSKSGISEYPAWFEGEAGEQSEKAH